MVKKNSFLRLLLFIILLPILNGCWDQKELQDLAIVTAAAIDLTEDKQIKMAVQIFIPRSLSIGESGANTVSGSTFVREGVGSNVAQAVANLQLVIPRKIFWGQCKVYIFGRKLAEEGIRPSLDYLLRNPSPRGRAYIYVSNGEGATALSLIPRLERYSGEVLSKLSNDKLTELTTLRELDIELKGESENAALPIVKILPPEKGLKQNETIPYIYGTALFRKDKLINVMDMESTRGLLWIQDQIKVGTITFKPENEVGEISLSPDIVKVKLIPSVNNNQFEMIVKVFTEGDVVQNETKLNMMNPAVVEKLNEDYRNEIKERILKTLNFLQEDAKIDVIGFAKRFHQKYPNEWKKVKGDWSEVFSHVTVHVEVDANIRRLGYINKPGALPEEKVKD